VRLALALEKENAKNDGSCRRIDLRTTLLRATVLTVPSKQAPLREPVLHSARLKRAESPPSVKGRFCERSSQAQNARQSGRSRGFWIYFRRVGKCPSAQRQQRRQNSTPRAL